MATTGVGFRWLDILEKEFDKACVELDTSMSELETEEPEVVFSARQKIATLSSCFAQLTHKALTIFQNSAKLEAELVDMRAELVQARAATAAACEDTDSIVPVNEPSRSRMEAAQLARENAALRETVLALHSELFGARLATKYLDKELAGRIQQLQLLGRDMRAELRDSLWAQVEAEILLQRHKTLVRVCRGVSPRPARPPPAPAAPARARPRTVRVRRSPHLGLGISVTGGREHGVPILISELEAGGPAALTRELYVGDAILAINDVDLTQACHKEAVAALQSVKGDCALCVQFIATDDDDRLSEDNYRFPLYPEDGVVFGPRDGDGATPTAPRTPDYTRNDSEDGSGSECESPYRPPYPDYNSINNNLAILDMDDDSIKIEARLEMVESAALPALAGSAAAARLLPAPGGSARGSALSTPVHARRGERDGKRRPQDWRTKGSYRRVGCDDRTLSDDTTLSDGLPESPLSPGPPLPVGPPPAGPIIPTGPVHPTGAALSTSHAMLSSTPLPGPMQPIEPSQPTVPRGLTLPTGSSQPTGPRGPTLPPGPAQREVPTAPLIQVLDPPRERPERPKTNGETKPVRRESKGFRIGSARRVVDSLPLTNGSERARALLAGDGDPDFGTPV